MTFRVPLAAQPKNGDEGPLEQSACARLLKVCGVGLAKPDKITHTHMYADPSSQCLRG